MISNTWNTRELLTMQRQIDLQDLLKDYQIGKIEQNKNKITEKTLDIVYNLWYSNTMNKNTMTNTLKWLNPTLIVERGFDFNIYPLFSLL